MSASKPAKQPRMQGQSQVRPHPSSGSNVEGNDIRTATPTLSQGEGETMTVTVKKLPEHPTGHKVRDLEDVWIAFGNEDSFLKMTESGTLTDVWIQLRSVRRTTTQYTVVDVLVIVFGSRIYFHEAKTRMAVNDIVNILYKNDCLQYRLRGVPEPTLENWLADKTSACISAHGNVDEDSTNRSVICEFVLKEDKTFTFYPSFGGLQNCGVFFRKQTVHGYKNKGDSIETEAEGMTNHSLIRCGAPRGKFEYEIQAALLPLPDEWFDKIDGIEDVPATQPL